MHVKTKQINHQVQRTLVVQAIAPFLACNLPVTILFLMIYLQSQNQYITIICSSILAWIPVVNPIAALMIIRFYRRKIFSIANKMFNMPPQPPADLLFTATTASIKT
uniref:Uncharacterized protein n=1 Tax=Panagrolaimus sp. PS1159 TaxID=55785 RepID=A0AC35F7T2_9BILA